MNEIAEKTRRMAVPRCVSILILWLGLFAAGSHSTAGEPAAGAEWIWTVETRQPGQTAFVRKPFEVNGDIAGAELACLADFNDLTVYLNGRRVADVENYESALRRDVSSLIVQGQNMLAAQGAQSDGPAAIAIRLDLLLKDGRRQLVVSDAGWKASPAAPPTWCALNFPEVSSWGTALSFGTVSPVMWRHPQVDTAISEIDDYTQWKQALNSSAGTDPSTFLAPPDFRIELLRSARPEEGSWISMEFDPQGRIIVAREERGLLRMELPPGDGELRVETIDETLLECRGLLCAHGSLYVNANNSRSLLRLRDTDGDDRYDEVKLLFESPGLLGHGRNDLALGPDGKIYAVHGDEVDLPQGFADRTSPFREHRQGRKSLEGCLWRFDPDGGNPELIAAGLRNPYGIDFHPDGEAFTYDADNEYDMGASWYRPTRINHLASGADFGWRGMTGWPPYDPDHPDNAPPALDIGKGSPTGVKFGTRSNFPPPYRQALFALDWAYGRILAVHLLPRGGSYVARAETFLRGRPLNVTDLDFGPDGAMYFVTGGRKTQSGLYRLRYVGPKLSEPTPARQDVARAEHATQARAVRRRLEAFHGRQDPEAIDLAWPHLGSSDPAIRYAARIAVEQQPVESWKTRALAEPHRFAAVTALMALARSPVGEPVHAAILERLNELSLAEYATTGKLIALHTYGLCLAKAKSAGAALRTAAADRLAGLYPDASREVNAQLCRRLVSLASPNAVPKTLELLSEAVDQRERMHYLLVLRDATQGWTPDLRRSYVLSLREMRQYQGGARHADVHPENRGRGLGPALARRTPRARAALGGRSAAERAGPTATLPARVETRGADRFARCCEPRPQLPTRPGAVRRGAVCPLPSRGHARLRHRSRPDRRRQSLQPSRRPALDPLAVGGRRRAVSPGGDHHHGRPRVGRADCAQRRLSLSKPTHRRGSSAAGKGGRGSQERDRVAHDIGDVDHASRAVEHAP